MVAERDRAGRSNGEFVLTRRRPLRQRRTTFDGPLAEVRKNQPRRPTRIETALALRACRRRASLHISEKTGTTRRHDRLRDAATGTGEVDFTRASYIDIAVDTLELLAQQCGAHPDISSRREQINQLQTGAVPKTDVSPVIEHGEVSITSDLDITPAAQEPEPEIAFNIPVDAAPDNEAEPAFVGIDAGLAEIFEEYRASSESEGADARSGDYETHYNLGLAYKDMDLFEDALEEFQMAASLTSPADGTGRYLQCCNLLGHCFVQTGAPEVAVKWFAKGLSAAHVSDEERMALTYEIGAAYEQAGDLHHALESFTEVYGNNVSYRNVKERLKTLKARLGEKSTITPPVTRSEQLVN